MSRPDHTFTQSGLGAAPFSICSPNNPDAQKNTAFFCEHCGRMLRNRFFVRSADGKVSVVGSSCVEKTGDEGLIAGVKRQQREAKAQARMAQHEAKAQAWEEAERKHFGGKTRDECLNELQRQSDQLLAEASAAIMELEAVAILRKAPGSFAAAMIARACELQPFTKSMEDIIAAMVTKAKAGGARSNSAAFQEAALQAKPVVAEFLAKVEEYAQRHEELRTKRADIAYAKV